MEEGQLEASNLPANIWHSEVTVSVTGEPPSAVEEEKETAEETEKEKEVLPEIVEPLSILDVLRISAVLEDTADQLSILNYIMPVQYERKQSVIMKKNKSLEKLAEAPRTSRLSSPFLPKEESKLPEIKKGSQFTDEFNKLQDLVFKKLTRQTIMSTEILKKIQIDRQFFSDIITKTMQELEESGTFTSLLEALGKERENKMHFYDIIAREEKGKKQIKSLQKHLFTVKKERQAEIQSRNEYIAHLKDQLQEMKAKTNMENRYMKRNTDLQISQTQKKCNRTEELLLEEIEKLEEKLEFWMEKFDKDTEMKQNELNALKSAKASDLAHLQELAKTIREYEQVIIEDRTEKEKTRKKIEQEDLELKSIIKLQAWWRGTMVRREIGGFKMPKKDKDDVKDSKGKGKDKNKRTGKKK
ncbi:dynein regulatory complex protein 9 isoform X2 [Canis lupus baileyi]|uniref:Dynein regulatory complex protein 9 n=1 Tax=Canis lupus familiaris TaxID=9615 RepID=A0A8P0TF57_CANLF|nr:dynein regulatory complex protein 9 isoform X2 [Canis lupus familiaris]XP_025330367.1 dynein regulatory complex protein 9 isoform X2 [Canis lupus dingo]XP_038439020.1 dynein regulatory complex protein 9 isoform X2 [Canis lupus familiaris]|eukprot:XP_013965768.1 IQ domain-containing protein G isoform X2 [Canis lupus familiaris]